MNIQIPSALGLSLLLSCGSLHARSDACGRVSTFPIAPRTSEFFSVKITAIDGSLPGPSSQTSYRLAPGEHELTLVEQIDSKEYPDLFSKQRPQWDEKKMTIAIEAGKTYQLAAKLLDAGAGGPDYWEPQIWKTLDEACSQ